MSASAPKEGVFSTIRGLLSQSGMRSLFQLCVDSSPPLRTAPRERDSFCFE